ncbi:MAG: metal-sulfur cluster assembly factor [Candidatus Dormibacteraeota bacterium]|nr:metal-sulfur cluster assembly factor [Candidatus Dormibacteraeota bacterium]
MAEELRGAPSAESSGTESPGAVLRAEDVEDALREVIDPELGLDIVSLGLIYGVDVKEDGDTNVRMTLTSPYCPLGPMIESQVHSATQFLPGIKDVTVELVWDPPWDPRTMASDEVKLELGLY